MIKEYLLEIETDYYFRFFEDYNFYARDQVILRYGTQ